MWKKDETNEEDRPGASRERSDETRAGEDRPRGTSRAEQATIGSSIRIRGEVTGDEDLVIEGHVDGTVELDQHSLTVGPDGEVEASIVARLITVEGRVEGDLSAEEQIVLRSSARVEGDISAPRVVLEDGARFRGSVDMGERSEREDRTSEASRSSRSSTGTSQSRQTSLESSASSSEDGTGESDRDQAVEATT